MIDIDGIIYVVAKPEHGNVRGRRARITIDGVPHVRADKIPVAPTSLTASDLIDALRSLDFDDIILDLREMVSHGGALRSRPGGGAHVGTMIDLLRSVSPGATVTIDGEPVAGIERHSDTIVLRKG